MKIWFNWIKPRTLAEQIARELDEAQKDRLEAAAKREMWEGYERILRARITRLEAERVKLERGEV